MTLHGGSADVSCDASGRIRFSLHFPQAAPQLSTTLQA